MSIDKERMQILEMIESGLISAEEGIHLLQALRSGAVEEVNALPESDQEQLSSQAPLVFEAPPSPVNPAGTNTLQNPAAEQSSYKEEEVLFVEDESEIPVENVVEPEDVIEAEKIDLLDFAKMGHWRNWWRIPLWIGVVVTVMAGILMYLAWQASGIGFWFACTWFPFLLGVAVTALAWASRKARWLHLRVTPADGSRKIAISLPLPLRAAGWFFRTFQRWIPDLPGGTIDQAVFALEHTSADAPLYLEVNDEEDGDRVEIFIG